MKLHYVEQGTGEPMVLLHGNGEDGTYFKNQIPYFSENYRVIAVDTRGHGMSPRGIKPFTLKQFAKDLKKFLDEMNLKDIILLGFSDGGNIALIFTLMYPGYVKKLILNGANLNPFGIKAGEGIKDFYSYASLSVRSARNSELVHKKELLGLMVREPFIPYDKLKEITVPTLVIAGTNDMIKTRHTMRIHRLIPGSSISIIEGNHFIAVKKSSEFNQSVERFLKIEKRQ